MVTVPMLPRRVSSRRHNSGIDVSPCDAFVCVMHECSVYSLLYGFGITSDSKTFVPNNKTSWVPDFAGNQLRDQTCEEMAGYVGRLVGWYTNGGFTDECGVKHMSGLNYTWQYLSVLNEDEHHMQPEGGVEYTICYDAIKRVSFD